MGRLTRHGHATPCHASAHLHVAADDVQWEDERGRAHARGAAAQQAGTRIITMCGAAAAAAAAAATTAIADAAGLNHAVASAAPANAAAQQMALEGVIEREVQRKRGYHLRKRSRQWR